MLRRKRRGAFSLVEVLLVVTLLSLIVLALMNVFSATQTAFRASVTQTDVLEGGRTAMEMIATDLRGLTASGSTSNVVGTTIYDSVNFFTLPNNTIPNNSTYAPLVQSLTASSYSRTNLLNYFFLLGRNNNKWTGIGYVVNNTNSTSLYPLYRYYTETNTAVSPYVLFSQFYNVVSSGQWTNSNLSHIMDGVVHLVVRAHDPKGSWINNNFSAYTNAANTFFRPPAWGEAQFYMFSNTIPAAIELQLGILEDRSLQRAGSLPFNTYAQSNYLSLQAGHVHIFRQLVNIPNVNPSAYQ